MSEQSLRSFIVSYGFSIDEASRQRAESGTKAAEDRITAANAAALAKRVAEERKAQRERISIDIAAGRDLAEADRRFIAEDAKRRDEAETANRKSQDESFKRQRERFEQIAKASRQFALSMTAVVTGAVAAIGAATGGILSTTDRVAKQFERLHFMAQSSGSSVKGLQAFGFGIAQLGGNAESAEAQVTEFGKKLATFPQFEKNLQSMGIATRDAAGHMRDATEIAKEFFAVLAQKPRATQDALGEMYGFDEETIRAGTRPGLAGYMADERARRAQIGADGDLAGERGVTFERAMRRLSDDIDSVKVRIETALMGLFKPALDTVAKWVEEHGKAISTTVIAIANGISEVVSAFVNTGIVKDSMKALSDGLDEFARYISAGDFKKDIKNFVSDVGALAKSLRSALEWLGIVPSRSSAAVVPEPTVGSENPGGGQPADIYVRGMHGRKPSDLTPEQVQHAQDKFHAMGGEGGTRSWRNNNPGNISAGKFANAHGADGSDGRFAHFPDYATGRKAQEDLWFNSDLYKGKTLAGAVTMWSPPSENDTAGIIKNYAAAVGVDPNTPLSGFTPEQRAKLLDAQQSREGWREGRRANSVSPVAQVEDDSPEVAEARRYLSQTATGAAAQRADSIVKLNPAFVLAAAKSIKQARAEGINAGIGSGYRSFSQTGSAYDAKGFSGHSYGIASDFSGIGAPGSAEARRFDEITKGFGLGGYGPDNPREWNHKELGRHLQYDSQRLAAMLATLGPNGDMVDPKKTWAASGYVLPAGSKESFPDVPKAPPTPVASRTFGSFLAQSGAGAPQRPQGEPVQVEVTDASATKIGKAGDWSEAKRHLENTKLIQAALHGNLHPFLHGASLTPAERARRIGHQINTHNRTASVTHSPTYHVHASDVKAALEVAKRQGERGSADLIRNIQPMLT